MKVGRDVLGVGGGVGEDRDLGGAGLGVDADDPLEQALGGGDVDVARAGHEAHREALAALPCGLVLESVGESRHGLGAAHGPHLVDAEQGAGGEDRRVGVAGEDADVLLLRRAGNGERADPGDLRGHDVHHDGRRVDRPAAGNVETDALDGDPSLGDGAAATEVGRGVGTPLVGVHRPGALDSDLEGRAHARVERVDRGLEDLLRDAQGGRAHPVEALGEVVEGGGPTVMDLVADRPDRVQGGLDVVLGPRQGGTQLPGAEGL